MTQTPKYIFGFTSASLRLNETISIEQYRRERGIANFNDIRNRQELVGFGNVKTSKLEFHEIKNRLQTLSEGEIHILLHGDFNSQKQVAFLGVCKHYLFIRDFTLEVVRERVQVFNYQLSEVDYLSFVRRKQESHPELERLSDTTKIKVKQVVFKILEQSGIIDDIKSKTIQPQLLSSELVDAIMEDNPEWLKVFLYSDNEITELKKIYGKLT